MIREKDLAPILYGAQRLEEILTQSGFTSAQFRALLASELETPQLLSYIDAVLANRMN